MTTIRVILIGSVLLAAYDVVVLSILVPNFWLVPVAALAALVTRRVARYTAYGTARWADTEDLARAGLLEGTGLLLGRVSGKPTRLEGTAALFDRRLAAREAVVAALTSYRPRPSPHLVRLSNAVHTIVCAPTGVGKGVSIGIPFLLTCRESVVVNDPKGDNYTLTAGARRRMGHTVVGLDPLGACGPGGHTFNPLQFIDRDAPTALDDIRSLAEAVVIKTGHEHDPHWNAAAELWITGMMAAVVAFAEDRDRNLQSVRTLLTNPAKMQAAITFMCESDLWQGMLARIGHQLTQFKDKELASVLTTTNRHLNFLDTIAVANNTRTSTFDPAALLTGTVAIYLIVPPEYQRTLAPLMRLWVTSLLRTVVRGGLSSRRVHFLVDEAASLGRLEVLDDAVDKYRSYGVRLVLLYQSLGQLKTCWPDGRDQTLLSNCTQVFFGINDYPTAEYVSNRLGDYTEIVASGGTNVSVSHTSNSQGGGSSSVSRGRNWNWQQAGRKLLQASEVTQLDPRTAVTFHPGVPPITTTLVRYYERNFHAEHGIGLFKAWFDAACLFVPASGLAVMVTALLVGIFK